MSMFDNLKSKLGIDTEADSYIDDTEDEIFAGGQCTRINCQELSATT